jgi:hypothetical protein
MNGTNLTDADVASFQRLSIPLELLEEAGVRRITDQEARELGYRRETSAHLEGILFPYLGFTGENGTGRLRRDHPEKDSSGKILAKYLTTFGDKRHFYVLPSDRLFLTDITVPVAMVEAEKSKLSLTSISRASNRPLFAIGLGGCYGWRGKIGVAPDPDGTRVDVKGPLSDFDHITWIDRHVYVILDSNVASNPNVQAAERQLERELRRRGAIVHLVHIPEERGVNGPDDYVGKYGAEAFYALFDHSEQKRRFKIVDIVTFVTKDIPPREDILGPIIQTQSTNMLYSKRGVGKTFMTLAMGCAVATGGIFLGRWKAPKPRKVLYIDGEMPRVTMQRRLRWILAGMQSHIRYGSDFDLITPDEQDEPMPSLSGSLGQEMAEDAIALQGAELLILDNISTLTSGGKENEAESWLPIQQWVLSLRRQGISVLLIHHAGRNGEQRGTSRREDILDTMITLRHPEDYDPSDAARFEVHYTKFRNSDGSDANPFEVEMRIENDAAIWTTKNVVDPIRATALEMFDSGKSLREIEKALGISKSKAGRIIQRFKDRQDEQ